jgi:transcriptional regulator of NAD metabolism
MKKLIAITFLGLAFSVKSQSIVATAGSNTAKIKADGSIEVNNVVKGYIRDNGNIENASNVVIGYIKSDNTIENANHTAVGYFMSNYDVHDASHTVIGHLRTNLDVKNAANVKIGTYNDHIAPVRSAVAFFFFKP